MLKININKNKPADFREGRLELVLEANALNKERVTNHVYNPNLKLGIDFIKNPDNKIAVVHTHPISGTRTKIFDIPKALDKIKPIFFVITWNLDNIGVTLTNEFPEKYITKNIPLDNDSSDFKKGVIKNIEKNGSI